MNDLIYGKSNLDRIVSIEPGDDKAEVFRQMPDGSVKSEFIPCSQWLLFSEQLSDKFRRLNGNQPFRYLMEYQDRIKFREIITSSYKKNRDFFIIHDPKESLMVKDGLTYFKGMKVEELSVLSFDIEDTYGIGNTLREDGKILLIANTFRQNGNTIRVQLAYDDFGSQKEMLEAWIEWVRKKDPSILIGHNLYGHDLKVLNFACEQCGIDFALGRDGSNVRVNTRVSQFRKDGSQSYDFNNIHIYGREIVDTWFLAMKYDNSARREYESYGLKYIIAYEGLERKGRVHYDASKIADNYQKPEEWAKIKEYNKDDSDDPLKYFDLTIPSFFYYAQSIPRSFQHIINSATGGQINSLMVRAYLQQGHSIARASDKIDFDGAISFGVPGIHKNVFKIDVQSLYPSIILTHKLCNRAKDPQELFLKMMDYFTQDRIHNKELAEATGDRSYKDLSDAQKIVINSGFGFLAAQKLNYNSPKDAARVTEIGRECLKTAIKWASGKEYAPVLAEGDEDDAA